MANKINYSHGQSGSKPSDGNEWGSNERPDPDTFDWFWDTIPSTIDTLIDEFDTHTGDDAAHHNLIQVSNDGSSVLTQPNDINFGANLSVSDDGDGTVTVEGQAGYTDSDARSAVTGNVDAADLVGDSGSSGQVLQTDGSSLTWADINGMETHDNSYHSTNYLAESDYNPERDTHSRYSDSEAQSAVSGTNLNLSTLEIATNSRSSVADILLNANANISTTGNSIFNMINNSGGKYRIAFGDTVQSGNESYSLTVDGDGTVTVDRGPLNVNGNISIPTSAVFLTNGAGDNNHGIAQGDGSGGHTGIDGPEVFGYDGVDIYATGTNTHVARFNDAGDQRLNGELTEGASL